MAEFTYQHPEQIVDALHRRLTEITDQIFDLQSELASVSEELATAQEYLRLWKRMNGIPQDDGELDHSPPPPSMKAQKRSNHRNPDRRDVAQMARKIIEHEGRPLSRSELFENLRRTGLDIRGKDPQMVLSTMLWREREQIVRLPSYGYWLKEVPYPPANYDPSFDDLMGVASEEPEDGVIDDGEDSDVVSPHDL